MHVYFVRHGETDLSERNIHQSANTPLSERGRESVVSTAALLRAVNPDLLVSSEYTRALESARIIGNRTGLTPVTNRLFYEVVRPSKFHNTSLFSLETLWYVFLTIIHKENTTWHYKDGENIVDVMNRSKRALEYIESLRRTHKSVIIVSHTQFINFMVAYMCRSKVLGIFSLLNTFLKIRQMKNAGVIHLEYVGDGTKNTCSWRVVHNTT